MNSLGEKLRNYRKRARLSQFFVESAIGTSTGSLSRIENGEVNPSKETLKKIADVLKLSDVEFATLLDLKIYTPNELLKALNKISHASTLDETLGIVADILYKLYYNYNGGIIFLKENDVLVPRKISTMPNIKTALKYFPKPLFEYRLKLFEDSPNLLIRSAVENRCFESTSSYDFCIGYIPEAVTSFIEKIVNYSVGLSVPIRYKNQIIGINLFTKTNEVRFTEEEKELLELFSEQIGNLIQQAKILENSTL